MEKASKANTVIIMAAERGFPFDGYVSEGYKVVHAYKSVGFFGRVLREVCFVCPFLPKRIWYEKEIRSCEAKYFIIRDAIITEEYLLWLRDIFPDSQINFLYENLVGKARHIMPDGIPKGIRAWTFDPYDSEKYSLRLRTVMPYFHSYVKKERKKKYDLLFVGRDKGRGDYLIRLERLLNEKGFKTKFVIVPDSRLTKRKPYYHRYVSYEVITDWISESKAILNIGMENQQGITMRDIESYFNRIKLVTSNEHIKETDIYDENNTFFLKEGNELELCSFLKKEYVGDREVSWNNHSVEDMISEMTQ